MPKDTSDADAASHPDAITEEEQEHDSRISAKMHLFIERMVSAAREEEGIGQERANDLMLCTAVQYFAEQSSLSPQDIGVFCRRIAEEAVATGADEETLH